MCYFQLEEIMSNTIKPLCIVFHRPETAVNIPACVYLFNPHQKPMRSLYSNVIKEELRLKKLDICVKYKYMWVSSFFYLFFIFCFWQSYHLSLLLKLLKRAPPSGQGQPGKFAWQFHNREPFAKLIQVHFTYTGISSGSCHQGCHGLYDLSKWSSWGQKDKPATSECTRVSEVGS